MPGRGRSIVTPHSRRAFLVGALVGCASTIVGMSLMFRRNSRGILSFDRTGSIMVNTKEARRPRVICFGDSLTQHGFEAERLGWLAQLAHWWERQFDVINRGFSGYNTRWLLPLVERIFVDGGHTPTKLVTIFLGANDCVLPGFFQHVPIEEYKQNLREMVTHVRRVHPQAKLLLITPPAIHERKWNEHRMAQSKDLDRKLEFTMSYAQACNEVGKEMFVRVVDAFAATGSGDEALADKFFHDGVHFTAEGHQVLFQAVKQEILTFFPELNPERVEKQAPHFSEVDPENYRESVLRGIA